MNFRHLISIVFFCSTLLTACDSSQNVSTKAVVGVDRNNWANQPYTCPTHSLTWSDVNDWHYQLQFMDYSSIASTKYDLVVMDSEPSVPLNSNVIDRIRCAGDGEKLVMAYLPIGKAENFRKYWQTEWTFNNPSWIATPYDDWPGEYLVRYWEPDWKRIIMGAPESRLDAIIAAGFDGVVLDGVDLYQRSIDENPNALSDMHQFINEIHAYAVTNSGNSNFGVFVQNTEELINEPSLDWTANLTGIVKPSHFYAPVDQPISTALSDQYTELLSNWTAANKLVLTLDYATNPANIDKVYSAAAQRGYIALTVPTLELDKLQIPQGYEPD